MAVAAGSVVAAGTLAAPAAAAPTIALGVASAIDEEGNGAAQATIGEGVVLELRSGLPAGLTLDSGRVRVDLPAGLTTTGEAPLVEIDGAPLPASAGVEVTAGQVTVTLPAGHATGDGQELVLGVATRVDDVQAAVDDVVLRPTAELVLAPEGAAPQVVGGQWGIVVVEPEAGVNLVDEDGWYAETYPGRRHTAEVVIYNRGSTAHDVTLTVTLEPRMSPRGADGAAQDGEVLAVGGVWDAGTRTITWHRDAVPPGYTTGELEMDIAPGPVHVPDAITWVERSSSSSMPGDVTGERTARSGINAWRYERVLDRVQPYAALSDVWTVLEPWQADRGDVITVTHRFTFQPGVTTDDLTVLDTLPEGLEYLGTESATCVTPGCGLEVVALEPDGERLGWFVGDVDVAQEAPGTVAVVYRARVTEEAVEESYLEFRLLVGTNASDQITGTPAAPPREDSFDDVREPEYESQAVLYIRSSKTPFTVETSRWAEHPDSGVSVGHEADFAATVSVPDGSVVAPVELTLGLSDELVRTSGTAEVSVDGGPLPAGWSVEESPRGVVVRTPDGEHVAWGAVSISLPVRVPDSPGVVHGTRLAFTVDVDGDPALVHPAHVELRTYVREPQMVVSATTDAPSGPRPVGSTVTHLVEPSSTSGTAYDVGTVMVVDRALTPLGRGGRPAPDGAVLPGGGVWDAGERTVSWSEDVLHSWDAPRYEVRALVENPLDVRTATSVVEVTASSQPGDVPGERTPASAVNGDRYRAESSVQVELGTVRSHVVSGRVWWDGDGDGVREGGEAPLRGVRVDVAEPGADGAPGTADDVVASVTTGDRGEWKVRDLPPGTVRITVAGGLPAGMVPTADPDGVATPWTAEVLLSGGAPARELDFGATGTSSVEGRVWVDQDEDRSRDTGEPGVRGVRMIVMHLGVDGRPGGADDVAMLVRTARDGSFRAGRLPAGAYAVVADPTTFPRGTVAWTDGDGGSPTYTATTLAPGEHRAGVDFGLRALPGRAAGGSGTGTNRS